MTTARLAATLDRLTPPPTDAALLARFAGGRCDAAFAELVRRHGPAVFAVCRRLTADRTDAEDAFQATFLVLARKADRLGAGDVPAAWLVGVAARAARKAAARTWRRRARETPVADVPDVPDRTAEPFDPDAARAVVEEVERLSAPYRAAVVLCELEGRSRAAAARELGVPEGTLSSRLAAARKQLAARLTARGYGPAALAALAPVAVPPALAAGPPSPAVAALIHGVGRAMFLRKLRLVPLAAVAVLALGVRAAPQPGPAADPAGATPRPLREGRILLVQNNRLVLIDPDGKNATRVGDNRKELTTCIDAKLSPDGKRVAFVLQFGLWQGQPWDRPPAMKLYLCGVGANDPVTDTGHDCATVFWSPDGSELLTVTHAGALKENAIGYVHRFYNPATGAVTPFNSPRRHTPVAWLADGRTATAHPSDTDTGPKTRLWRVKRDGSIDRPLGEDFAARAALVLSPDEKRFLARYKFHIPDAFPLTEFALIDAATGRATPVEGVPRGAMVVRACWSPDGRRIAYTLHQFLDRPGGPETETRVVVADPDGKNPRTIVTQTEPGQRPVTLWAMDWR